MNLIRKSYANGAKSLFDLTPEEQINYQRMRASHDGVKDGTAITVFVKCGNKITNEIAVV